MSEINNLVGPEDGELQGATVKRPSWDEYFIGISKLVSTRATCLRKNIGSVIVKDKKILATGYNGSPPGLPHCLDVGCLMVDGHCIRTIHAEQNAFIQAARHGIAVDGATLYITVQPCNTCAKMLINAGVKKVVFEGDYPDEIAMDFLNAANIEIVRFNLGEDK